MGEQPPPRKTKRPAPGGSARRPDDERRGGDLVLVTSFPDRFAADVAVALAESYGYQVLVQQRVGYATWGTSNGWMGADIVAHPGDVLAVRELFAAHDIDVRQPEGLHWRGALVAVIVLVCFFGLAAVLLAAKG